MEAPGFKGFPFQGIQHIRRKKNGLKGGGASIKKGKGGGIT